MAKEKEPKRIELFDIHHKDDPNGWGYIAPLGIIFALIVIIPFLRLSWAFILYLFA